MGPSDTKLTSLQGISDVGWRTTVPPGQRKEIAPPGGRMAPATRSSSMYPGRPEARVQTSKSYCPSPYRDYCRQLQRFQLYLTKGCRYFENGWAWLENGHLLISFSLSFLVLGLLPYSKPVKGSPLSILSALSLKPRQQAPGLIFGSCWPPTGRNAACFFLCLCCSGNIRSLYKPPTTVPFAWRSFWRAGATVDSLWSLLRRCVLGERRCEITFRWMRGLIRPVVSMHSSFLAAPTVFLRAILSVKCPYVPSLGFLNLTCSHPEWTAEYEKGQRQY